MLTDRQEKLLNFLVKEYIITSQPVSSELLKKVGHFDVSPATVRNDLQALTKEGFIDQPHTSSGRIPTNKAYRFYVQKVFSEGEEQIPDFIEREIKQIRLKVEEELHLAHKLISSLEEMSFTLSFNRMEEDMLFEILKMLGPSQNSYQKDMGLINELIKKLESF